MVGMDNGIIFYYMYLHKPIYLQSHPSIKLDNNIKLYIPKIMIIAALYYTIIFLIINIIFLWLLTIQKKTQYRANHEGIKFKLTTPYFLPNQETSESLRNIRSSICSLSHLEEENWKQLEIDINMLFNNFAVQVKKDFPILTKDDIRIILLLRIELSHEDIARLCNIQLSSFRKRRSRLKKKMNIECDSISEFIKEMYCSPLSIPRS